MSEIPKYTPVDKVPLPPPDAKVYTTACDHCIVACGYKVYVWPEGREGGPRKGSNALGVDYPAPKGFGGVWISPNQHAVVPVNGQMNNVLVLPDKDAEAVNLGGNHSVRGGLLAKKCYSPNAPTADRLQHPLLRVNGKLEPISWDDAIAIMAAVSKHVIAKYGASAWAMKHYSYQYWENTYAISKLAYESIETPAACQHDKPSEGDDTPGMDDSGIITFCVSYEDWKKADVIFISGSDPYETKSTLFTTWMMNGPKLIFANPRKSTGVAYGEANGGLWLDVIPGSDTVLHMAIARLIIENGWEDKEFLAKWIGNVWESDSGFGRGWRETPWQWRTTWGKVQTDWEGYKKWLLSQKESDLDTAVKITGVAREKILKAAEMLAKPKADGTRVKASFAFEKGLYFSNNYLNTLSLAALGFVCGAGNREGQMIARLGGHQRGWLQATSYPASKSPDKLPGRRRAWLNLDKWVRQGKAKFAWVMGTTWTGAMAASQDLEKAFRRQTSEHPVQVTSKDRETAIKQLIDRIEQGGMVIADSDIYLIKPMGAEFADIVLPAATWGEVDFARANGERRLRLYSKFMDPPGEAQPDWWAIAKFAKAMGFEGYDWKTSADVFDEAARVSRGGVLDYYPLVWLAKQQGKKGHEALRELGTTGIQTPIRYVDGKLVGTKRLHDPQAQLGSPDGPTVHAQWLTAFNTQTGKALIQKSPWDMWSDFYTRITPKGDELWLTLGRVNELWQSSFDDIRKAYIMQRWPDSFVEIHPEDAAARGVESGDLVELYSDDVLVQDDGFILTDDTEWTFTEKMKRGYIRVASGRVEAVAIVTDGVKKGVMFTNFLWSASPANALTHAVPDMVTERYPWKLGKARVRKLGESPFKRDDRFMSFLPRTII
ncbi:MAG TPA: molybdopterin-dependent oxidoreductase [Symbiobacteriaceae bacterium]|jgi:arsenite oxidase large subunit